MSVIVQYDPAGRLGNRMFQYAFGRILSLKKNTQFFAEYLPNFLNTFDGDRSKSSYLNFISKNSLSLRKTYGNHYVNMDELLTTNQDIIVDSFLQKYYYYTDYQKHIKEWFQLQAHAQPLPKENELVIHIRETDYKIIKTAIPFEYYEKTINQLGFKINTIVTDDPMSQTIQKLQSLGCNIFTSQPVQTFRTSWNITELFDFYYMLKAKHLLMSHSTFSWWPAFLGAHEHVFCPDINNSMWKQSPEKDDIDLFIKNSNFIKI